MKKRILATLLAMTLVISGLPITAYAATASTSAQGGGGGSTSAQTDPLENALWSTNVTPKSDTLPDNVTNDYVHIHGIEYYSHGMNYSDSAVTLDSASLYRLSFYIRGTSILNGAATRSVLAYLNNNIISATSANGGVAEKIDASLKSYSRIIITDTWEKVSMIFSGDGKTLNLLFSGKDPGGEMKDVTPFDIRGLELYKLGATYEAVSDNLIDNTTGIWSNAGATGSIINYTESDFYSVDKANPTAELSGIELEAGKYSLTAKFRLNTFDFSLCSSHNRYHSAIPGYNTSAYSANLTAVGAEGITVVGAVPLALKTEWNEGTFNLDVREATDIGEISFTLDKSLGFDIADITITKVGEYSSDYSSNSANPIDIVYDTVTDGTNVADGVDKYIHLSGLRIVGDGMNYVDEDVQVAANESYDVSFWIRAAYSSEWELPKYNSSTGAANGTKSMMTGGVGYTQVRISLNGGTAYSITPITNTWQKVTATLTSKNAGDLKIAFIEKDNHDILPYDVAGFSVVKSGETTELAEHALQIKSASNNAGWELKYSGYKGTANIPANYLKLDTRDVENYNHASAPASGNTEIYVDKDAPLATSVYRVSGDFRLSDIKSSKIEFSGVGSLYHFTYIKSNNNKTTITAAYNGTELSTVDGATAEITTEWTNASFVLVVPNGGTYNENKISFVFGENAAIDFKNIKIEAADDIYDLDYTDINGDYVKITKDAHEDGIDKYVHLSNLRLTNDGMDYVDEDISVAASESYTVSFWIRAAYSSEWNIPKYNSTAGAFSGTQSMMNGGVGYTQVRISINGGTAYTITPITNEWQKVTATLVAKNAGTLKVAFREIGNYDILPYDVAGFSVVKSGETTELAEHALEIKTDTNNAGWAAVHTGYRDTAPIPKDINLEIIDTTNYNHVNAPTSGNTEIRSDKITELTTGIYHVSGDFRLSDIKSSNIEFGFENSRWNLTYIVSNNNKTTVTAAYNGTELSTIDGTAAEITTEWTNASFILVVPNGEIYNENMLSFTFGENAAIDFKNITCTPADELYHKDFVNGDGSLISAVTEDRSYLHVYDVERWDSSVTYNDSVAKLYAGKVYKLSLDARTVATVNSPKTENGVGYRIIRFDIAGATVGGSKITNKTYRITDDWASYNFQFTVENDTALKIKINGSNLEDIIPIYIDNFSIVDVDTDAELVRYGETLSSSNGWSTRMASAEIYSGEEYYKAYAPTNGSNTAVVFNGEDTTLVPGVYNITGKFRLTEPVDYDKISYDKPEDAYRNISSDLNGAYITAFASEPAVQLKTANGSESVWIDRHGWNEVSFVLDIVSPISINSIKLELDGAYELDFCNVRVDVVERRISLSDIDSSMIIALLLLKQKELEKYEYVTADGELIMKKGSTAANEYTRLHNVKSANAYLRYIDSSVVLDANTTYELSFKARTDIDSSDWDYRMNGHAFRYVRIRAAGGIVLGPLQLTPDWQKFSTRFKGNNKGLSIDFIEQTFWDMLPYCVDEFSLINTKTGEQLVKYETTVGEKGWSTNNSNGMVSITKEIEYYSVDAPKSGNTEFKYNGKDNILTSGTWYVSGDFRINDFKKANLEWSVGNHGWITIDKDTNGAVLTAMLDGSSLPTNSGNVDGVEIGNEWTTANFMIKVDNPDGIKKSDILFTLNDGMALDFKNMAFFSEADMAYGLLRGAISENGLKDWTYGDQRLEYKVDEDGTEYLAASNIKDNRVGFTYESDVVLNAGVYFLSGDFRTSVEGETGYVRVMVSDSYNTIKSIKINNEWNHLETAIVIKSSSPVKFKLCGAAISTSVQNYDIANLKLVNASDIIPSNTELFEAGNFNDAENAMSLVKPLGAYARNVSYEQDENGGFIRMFNRPNEYCSLAVYTGVDVYPGTTYKISYDIRTSVEGEEMVARSYVGTSGTDYLKVDGETFNNSTFMYPITHEWRHVEAIYTAADFTSLIVRIGGGMDPVRDLLDFDIDNFSVIKLDN